MSRTTTLAAALIACTLVPTNPADARPAVDPLEIVSRAPFNTGSANFGDHQASERRAFSNDGRYLAFTSSATALVSGVQDLNGRADVFVRDFTTGVTTLISHRVGQPQIASVGTSRGARISGDGRWVLFDSSQASDLPGGSNGVTQVYLYDRSTGTHQLISRKAGAATPGTGASSGLDLSEDGRYVAFWSRAQDLTTGITYGDPALINLFLWDRVTDSLQLASRRFDSATTATGTSLNGLSSFPATQLTPDGRYLAFLSRSRVMVAGDTSMLNTERIYLFDRISGSVESLSRAPSGQPVTAEELYRVSDDGRYALFSSTFPASNFIPSITNDPLITSDVFLFDRQTTTTEMISIPLGTSPFPILAHSLNAMPTEDFQGIYFISGATDLAAGVTDTNEIFDLFLRDRSAGVTRLLSRSPADPALAVGANNAPSFPDAGGLSILNSYGPLVAGLPGPGNYVYRYDLALDHFGLLSHAPGQPAQPLPAFPLAATSDGARQLWRADETAALSGAHDPQPDGRDMVLFDRGSGEVELVNAAAAEGVEAGAWDSRDGARMSEDGRKIAFSTTVRLCAADQPWVDRRLCLLDRENDEMVLVSHRWNDPAVAIPAETTRPLELSQDGRWLLLQSSEADMAPTDSNGSCDLFLYDTQNRTFELVSHPSGSPTAAGGQSCQPYPLNVAIPSAESDAGYLSGDATRVVFASAATLIAGTTDGNGGTDVFLKDRVGSTLQLLSRSAASATQAANGTSLAQQISADGRFVLITSKATDLIAGFVDGNAGGDDLFLVDLLTGVRTLVSRSTTSPVHGGDGAVVGTAGISTDGRYVVFTSLGRNHVAGVTDAAAFEDVFLFDRAIGTLALVSRSQASPTEVTNGRSLHQGVSSDGRFVLFYSRGTNVAAGVSLPDRLYRWDRVTGLVGLVSHRDLQPGVSLDARWGRLSADGGRVLFTTAADNALAGFDDANGSAPDLFLWEAVDRSLALVDRRPDSPLRANNFGCPAERAQLNLAGDRVLFACQATDLVAHDGSSTSAANYFLATVRDSLFADGFERGDTAAWSATVP